MKYIRNENTGLTCSPEALTYKIRKFMLLWFYNFSEHKIEVHLNPDF